MKELEEAKRQVLALLDKEQETQEWVKWLHEGSLPAETSIAKSTNILSALFIKHCAKCMNLNGCYFLRRKSPKLPLHPNCHCETTNIPKPIADSTAIAECPIEKIERYVFFIDLDKKRFFESNGYDIMDSERIKIELEKQAALKYANGEYKLGMLDDYGQRITILIELSFEGKSPLTFLSGWMVYPNGRIVNTTPIASAVMKKIENFGEEIQNERI